MTDLLLDVNDVPLLEGEFSVILSLEAKECPGNHLAVLGFLASVEEERLAAQGVALVVPAQQQVVMRENRIGQLV